MVSGRRRQGELTVAAVYDPPRIPKLTYPAVIDRRYKYKKMEQVTDSIEQQIDAFLLATFPLARKSGIDRDSPLIERGILDSLGILDVVAFIESTFGITIDDEDLVPQNFQKLSAMSEFVRNKQRKHR